ncbi:unnamed protein product [Choristocarpus tenellus]
MIPQFGENEGCLSNLVLSKVCWCLASPDPAVINALLSRWRVGSRSATGRHSLKAQPTKDIIPSALGEMILQWAKRTNCLTDNAVLELLRWCEVHSLDLSKAPPTVTDALLVSILTLPALDWRKFG